MRSSRVYALGDDGRWHIVMRAYAGRGSEDNEK